MTVPSFGHAMARENLAKRAGYDVWLLALTFLLCTCGAIFVLTSSAAHSYRLYGGDSMAIFWNHLGRLGWGLACLVLMAMVDYRTLGKLARPLWIASVALLIVVLFVRQPAGVYACRWIYVGGFSFQPAELAKFALINYLALRFGALRDDPFAGSRARTNVGALTLTVITFSLVLIEPNLSMALLIVATAGLMFFLSRVPLRPLLILGGACLAPLALVAWFTPYMRGRLLAYVDGILHPMNASYHVRQSIIGIGQGGVTGLGLGGSTQKHFFLPEPYKDFIFSIIGEELGLIGALFIVAAFAVLLMRAWQIGRRAPDGQARFLAQGITCALALSFVVNVGVTLGVLPATGQPLPFISYGGSSLMMTLGAVGVLLNISKHAQRRESNPDEAAWFV